METIIREARLTDYDAIAQLSKNDLGYDYPPEKTKRQLEKLLDKSGHKICVAQTDGQVTGYIHAQDYELLYAPPYKNILGIAVARAYRGRGIGRMLLQAVENWARETGSAGVRLCSGESRTGAHAFYAACGYACTKNQKNFKKSLV